MELIFTVREAEDGSYIAKAPGQSIIVQSSTWEALRKDVVEAANRHFASAPAQPDHIRLHLVKDELIDAKSGEAIHLETPDSWLQKLEPSLATAPGLQPILAELSAREPIFHRPEFGTTRADFERITTEDYWETGASGRRYSRAAVLDELEKRFSAPHQDVWETSEFQCRRLGPDTYLLTYSLLQDHARLTRRATIWRQTADGWKILYHQGTIVQGA